MLSISVDFFYIECGSAMSLFHDKPIFDQYDEDMDAWYTLEEQKGDPRHTFERTFSPLGYPYDVILQRLLDTKLITLPKSSSYENPFLEIYFSYHPHNDHYTLDCMKLKHKVQNLIDDGIVYVKSLMTHVMRILILCKIILMKLCLEVVPLAFLLFPTCWCSFGTQLLKSSSMRKYSQFISPYYIDFGLIIHLSSFVKKHYWGASNLNFKS